VGADLKVMEEDTVRMRSTPKGLKPFVMTNLKVLSGLEQVIDFIETRGMLRTA
jgi:urease accessory protein